MKASRVGIVAAMAAVSVVGSTARAGALGTTPFAVACGTTVTVTADTSGATLTLDASDPILAAPCAGAGLKIINKGSNAPNQFLTVDCQTNQAAPIKGSTGVGIMLDGPNLAAYNCYVQGFSVGVEAQGDGADIEDSQVENAVGDGFRIKSSVRITNPNIVGVTFTGNRAFDNGGWGFEMSASEISGGSGSFFNNIADANAKGGFKVFGDGNSLSGSEAFDNGGPGFLIVSRSCCSGSAGQNFDTAVASSNKGPGIIYEGRDDGSNCVGGTGPTCTGGTFFPAGFDTTPGGISAADNGGACPKGSLLYLPAEGVCPVVLGNACSTTTLDNCP
jgi:hypothetical protein